MLYPDPKTAIEKICKIVQQRSGLLQSSKHVFSCSLSPQNDQNAQPQKAMLKHPDFCNPAVLTAIFFGSGIACANHLKLTDLTLPYAMVTALMVIIAVCLQKKKTTVVTGLILTSFALCGFIHTSQQQQPPGKPNHLYHLIKAQQELTLLGTIDNIVTFDGSINSFTLNTSGIIKREQLPGTSEIIEAKGKVRLSLRSKYPTDLKPGQKIMVVSKIKRIQPKPSPGCFDYGNFFARKNIYHSGWIKSANHIEVIEEEPTTLLEKLYFQPKITRQRIYDFLAELDNPVHSRLYQALLVGERKGLPMDIQENFIKSGTVHLLAISGLHISLLSLLVYGIILFLLKRSEWILLNCYAPNMAMLLTFPFLLAYSFIAGLNPPVIRATLMAGLLLLAISSHRSKQLLPLICGVATLMLLHKPQSLFSASFQLSFAAIIGISLIIPKLPIPKEEDNIAVKIKKWLISALLVSTVATISNIPFTLYHFNRFSLIGPFSNLIIEPLICFIALPAGFVSLPFIFIYPEVAKFLLNMGGYGLDAAVKTTELLSQLPLSSLWTITPHPWEVVVFMALFIFLLTSKKEEKKKIRFVLLLVFLLFLNFTRGLYLPINKNKAEVDFIAVGKGNSSLVTINGKRILIDGGGAYSQNSSVGQKIIAPFLWHKRIWQIDRVVISHPDSDHYNGLEFIIERFRPRLVHTNDSLDNSTGYQRLLAIVNEKAIPIQKTKDGDVISRGNNCQLVCLGMAGIKGSENLSDNDNSLVLKLSCNGSSVLFSGDIEKKGEMIITENKGSRLASDILVAPHHGSKSSGREEFIQVVNPSLIIVSASGNDKNFPAQVNIRKWQQQNIPYLITGKDGTISCNMEKGLFECHKFIK